ncbi:MAG: XrtV sorting system accessory protein [Sandaracinobacteroides sp.]
METVYDWVTVAIFAGLIVLFLQRSVGPERDQMWPYFAASVACAVINQVGNKAIDDSSTILHLVSVVGIAAILGFIQYFLKPFGKQGE